MRVFGIDPGSERTGYGCVETDGRRHRLLVCGAISTSGAPSLAVRLAAIHGGLAALLREWRPTAIAVENLGAEATDELMEGVLDEAQRGGMITRDERRRAAEAVAKADQLLLTRADQLTRTRR